MQLTETHKTVKNIKARKAFTISIADAAHVVQADYFGVASGNKVADKFEKSGLTASKADMSLVNAIAFDPYTHGYYLVSERVGEAFKDGLQLK